MVVTITGVNQGDIYSVAVTNKGVSQGDIYSVAVPDRTLIHGCRSCGVAVLHTMVTHSGAELMFLTRC